MISQRHTNTAQCYARNVIDEFRCKILIWKFPPIWLFIVSSELCPIFGHSCLSRRLLFCAIFQSIFLFSSSLYRRHFIIFFFCVCDMFNEQATKKHHIIFHVKFSRVVNIRWCFVSALADALTQSTKWDIGLHCCHDLRHSQWNEKWQNQKSTDS